MRIFMATSTDRDTVARMRLQQLVSPGLPIGAFTYSQGLEWAVDNGWVGDAQELQEWIKDAMQTGICHLEIPVFRRLYEAYTLDNRAGASGWIEYLLASRETAELRQEEQQRGRAFARLIPDLGCDPEPGTMQQLRQTQLAGFAWMIGRWDIDPRQAIEAYTWSWLENMTLAGVKLIPLGQTDGQKIMLRLSEQIAPLVQTGLTLDDDEMGFSCTALAIASSMHETQYTRLYRS